LKKIINYYTECGTVAVAFTCFVDFSKAFDRVNHWKLFLKLIDDSVNCKIIPVSAFWNTHQSRSVLAVVCRFM